MLGRSGLLGVVAAVMGMGFGGGVSATRSRLGGGDSPTLLPSKKERRSKSGHHPSANFVAMDKRAARKARNVRRHKKSARR